MPKPLLAPGLSGLTGIAHGFFTRHGGVSAGIYASLNCGIGSKDDPAAVRENRAPRDGASGRRRSRLGLPGARDDRACRRASRGRRRAAEGGCHGDRHAGHCARRADGRLRARAVRRRTGARRRRRPCRLARGPEPASSKLRSRRWKAWARSRERIVAAVGPCIGLDAYEVGPEFKAEFLDRDSDSARFFSPAQRRTDGRTSIFPATSGIACGERAWPMPLPSALCTYARNEDFFSYRRTRSRQEPDYGRQISAIVLT